MTDKPLEMTNIEYEIADELIKRKRRLTMKQIQDMLARQNRDMVQDAINHMLDRGWINVKIDAQPTYQITTSGFDKWDTWLPF